MPYNKANTRLPFESVSLRVVHGSDGPGGSGHDLPDFGGSGRVSTSGLLDFLLIISWFLNRYESSNISYIRIDWFSTIFNLYNN